MRRAELCACAGAGAGGRRVMLESPGRKKAIVTKKPGDKGGKGEADEYQAPGGVKKISNSVVSGRGAGAMSYNPQVCPPPAPPLSLPLDRVPRSNFEACA